MNRQPNEDERFTRPYGPRLNVDDLHRYAEELNKGPMQGWFVNRMVSGLHFLDRQ